MGMPSSRMLGVASAALDVATRHTMIRKGKSGSDATRGKRMSHPFGDGGAFDLWSVRSLGKTHDLLLVGCVNARPLGPQRQDFDREAHGRSSAVWEARRPAAHDTRVIISAARGVGRR